MAASCPRQIPTVFLKKSDDFLIFTLRIMAVRGARGRRITVAFNCGRQSASGSGCRDTEKSDDDCLDASRRLVQFQSGRCFRSEGPLVSSPVREGGDAI